MKRTGSQSEGAAVSSAGMALGNSSVDVGSIAVAVGSSRVAEGETLVAVGGSSDGGKGVLLGGTGEAGTGVVLGAEVKVAGACKIESDVSTVAVEGIGEREMDVALRTAVGKSAIVEVLFLSISAVIIRTNIAATTIPPTIMSGW